MNLTIIEEEIENFNRDFFSQIANTAEKGLDFIEENNLHVPKEKYTIVGEFLHNTLKSFRILDSTFMSTTLKKIDTDITYMRTLYDETVEESKNIKNIFDFKFIILSPSFSSFAREVLEAQDIKNPSDEQRKRKKQLSAMLKEFKEVYFRTFQEIFKDDLKYFLESLSLCLNSKTYYFDKLLWKEAESSLVIKKHLQALEINNKLNTRDYLLYTTDLMRPYTEEYKYLQSCLRIYK